MMAMVGMASVEEKKLTVSPKTASMSWFVTPSVVARIHSHSMAATTLDTR